MTLDEKVSLTAGVDDWHTATIERMGVGPVKMTDGPNGARGATRADGESLTPSLCIPSGSALGATWDPAAVARASGAVARQAREKGAQVLLAPTVNLHRHPLWGRNFESFSEDPLLCGTLAAAYIRAVQEHQVIATVKHLVCNETEHERRMCSSEVDERTLRELYLLPFEFAVREADVQAVMTSYNRTNGHYLADDARVLAEILRGEWGFTGIVMTDWWALISTVEAAEAGLDIEMPGPGRGFGPALGKAVKSGAARESWVDDKVRRLLTVYHRVGALDDPLEADEHPMDRSEDRAVARQVAAAAMVLLKNDGDLLPLSPGAGQRVALIGPGAQSLATMGGGSARVVPHYELSLTDVLRHRLGDRAEVVFEPGCQIATQPRQTADDLGPEGIARAVRLAASSDVAIVVVGTNSFWESEGYDRVSMELPGRQADLVDQVLEANPRTVVVLNTGSPVALPFGGRAPALLQCWFGGQELANALVDVLLGDAEPGGRLPITLPERLEHTPAYGNFPSESSIVHYGEGQLVGYRWYDARHLPVAFPFGHGLSYTTMTFSRARASSTVLAAGGTIDIQVEVENIGARAGSEVVQVYVAPPGGGRLAPGARLRPVKALKGFAKVHLAAGEKGTVTVTLNERSFAYYDVADADWFAIIERLHGHAPDARHGLHRTEPGWYLDSGSYEVLIGRSSADICERLVVEVEGNPKPLPATAPVG